MTSLREAAQAVLDRWDSPAWEWSRRGPTAELMAALRAALQQEHDAESQVRAYVASAVAAERERCARLCEALADDCDMYKPLDNSRGVALRAAAMRIRKA